MSEPYIGEIRMFAGNFAPSGWAFCDGSLLAIADNDVLYTLIGNIYGGDGSTNFALPNLASRFPVHQGAGYVVGGTGGAETVTLTTPQLPAHAHPQMASSSPGTTVSPSGALPAAWEDAQYSTAPATTALASTAVTPSGGGQPHNNMPPYVCINFIIALNGIYPSTG